MVRAVGVNQVDEARNERIIIGGVVQGVGLRPFVCQQAAALGLAGEVRNTGAGLEIRVRGAAAEVAGPQ